MPTRLTLLAKNKRRVIFSASSFRRLMFLAPRFWSAEACFRFALRTQQPQRKQASALQSSFLRDRLIQVQNHARHGGPRGQLALVELGIVLGLAHSDELRRVIRVTAIVGQFLLSGLDENAQLPRFRIAVRRQPESELD